MDDGTIELVRCNACVHCLAGNPDWQEFELEAVDGLPQPPMRSRQREVSQAVGDADMEGALHHYALTFVVLCSVGVCLACLDKLGVCVTYPLA